MEALGWIKGPEFPVPRRLEIPTQSSCRHPSGVLHRHTRPSRPTPPRECVLYVCVCVFALSCWLTEHREICWHCWDCLKQWAVMTKDKNQLEMKMTHLPRLWLETSYTFPAVLCHLLPVVFLFFFKESQATHIRNITSQIQMSLNRVDMEMLISKWGH